MAQHCRIVKKPAILVRPSEPTPQGSLRLSFLDHLPEMRMSMDVAFVFERGSGEDPAKAIREGLSRALVHYYPVAGRLVELAGGELEIDCTGDGVWFVEASADRRLDGFSNQDPNLRLPFAAELMARPPPTEVNTENVIFTMQVTEFKCGGITVGITFNHTVFDGIGSAQFLNAVAELTRGLAEPTVSPTWCRELIPRPPKPTTTSAQGPTEPEIRLTFHNFKPAEFDVSRHSINQLKDRVAAETGQSCSTFDAVTAMLWQSRTRAINLEPDADVRLSFAANARRILRELLPIEGGYYGNCIYTVDITVPCKQVANGSLVQLVGLIREAKQTVPDGFSRWIKEGKMAKPRPLPNYQILRVTDWHQLGYSEIDFGWGQPSDVFPCGSSGVFNVVGACSFIKPPAPKQGIRLVMYCVEEQHSAALQDELTKFA